tara:strand:+ start:13772 stop:13894 length:123 start_codon:yes stop_codon:yes gene_type:complete
MEKILVPLVLSLIEIGCVFLAKKVVDKIDKKKRKNNGKDE